MFDFLIFSVMLGVEEMEFDLGLLIKLYVEFDLVLLIRF